MKGVRRKIFAILIFSVTLSGCAGKAVSDRPYMETKAIEAGHAGAEAFGNGDYRRALERFLESLRINRSVDNRRGEVMDLVNIGKVFIAMGHYKNAQDYLNDSLRLGVDLKDDILLSEAYGTLAKADYLSGDGASALDHIEESINIDGKDRVISGAKLNLKALIFIEAKRLDDASATLKTAFEVNREDDRELANSYRASGELNSARDDRAGAIEAFRKAYDMDKKLGDSVKIAADLESMAELNLKAGDFKEASFLFERAYIVSLNSGRAKDALGSIDKLIYTYKEMGNAEKASYYLRMKEGILSGNRM